MHPTPTPTPAAAPPPTTAPPAAAAPSATSAPAGRATDDVHARDVAGVLATLHRLGALGAAPDARGPAARPPVHVPRPDSSWRDIETNLQHGGATVAYATWTEWLPALLTTPHLTALLGRDSDRYTATRDAAVRCRFAASRLLIKYTAAAALGIEPRDIDIAYRLGGRPYLRGLDQVEVGLTHTGELMAVGISRTGRIGLDAERADRRFDLDVLLGQMCTPAERAQLQALPAGERQACALRLWTLKEAYTKALGQGMRLAFTAFGFGLTAGGLRTPDGAAALGEEWAFATHPVLGRYLISVACHDAGLDPAGDTSVGTMLDRRLLTAMTPPADDTPTVDI